MNKNKYLINLSFENLQRRAFECDRFNSKIMQWKYGFRSIEMQLFLVFKAFLDKKLTIEERSAIKELHVKLIEAKNENELAEIVECTLIATARFKIY